MCGSDQSNTRPFFHDPKGSLGRVFPGNSRRKNIFGPVFREEMAVIGPNKGLKSAPLVSRNSLRKFIVCVPIYSPKWPPCVPIKSPKASTRAPLLAPKFCLVLRVPRAGQPRPLNPKA